MSQCTVICSYTVACWLVSQGHKIHVHACTLRIISGDYGQDSIDTAGMSMAPMRCLYSHTYVPGNIIKNSVLKRGGQVNNTVTSQQRFMLVIVPCNKCTRGCVITNSQINNYSICGLFCNVNMDTQPQTCYALTQYKKCNHWEIATNALNLILILLTYIYQIVPQIWSLAQSQKQQQRNSLTAGIWHTAMCIHCIKLS